MGLGKKKILSQGASAFVAADNFNIVTYAGNGSTQSIEADFKPDLIWVKDRDNTNPHELADSVRGVEGTINSNTTNAEYVNASFQITSFNSNGFTVVDDSAGNYAVNGNNIDYVAWAWKAGGAAVSNTSGSITSSVSANVAAGFSIVKWVGNEQASQTIGHGLSSSPELAFIKQLDGGRDWIVPLFTETSGDYMELNDTAGKATDTNKWSAVSSTTFTVGADPYTNGTGSPYIGYFFTSVTGYSKIGSYTGNSNSSHSISTGFQPRFVMMKNTASGYSWIMQDSVRGTGVILYANGASQDNSTSTHITSFDSNGFTLGSNADVNFSGDTYIYLAIK